MSIPMAFVCHTFCMFLLIVFLMTLNRIFAWDRGSNSVIVVQSNTYHVLLSGFLVTQDILVSNRQY